MISRSNVYAIIGASNNEEKYGYIVLKDLKDSGYNVIPFNPREKKILDLKVYKKLSDFTGKIDVAVFIVPPKITEKVLEEVKHQGIKEVWMQPGSESKNAISFCEKNKIQVTYNNCIMFARRLSV